MCPNILRTLILPASESLIYLFIYLFIYFALTDGDLLHVHGATSGCLHDRIVMRVPQTPVAILLLFANQTNRNSVYMWYTSTQKNVFYSKDIDKVVHDINVEASL